MNVLIIEDEAAAAGRLKKLLGKIDPLADVAAILESVEDAISWFRANPGPDLIFADIQLSDGICFEIFEAVDVACPVVFVTAYDEYAIRAFRVNSIDYLLKPVNPKDLERSIEKFRKLGTNGPAISGSRLETLMNSLDIARNEYKSRFLVKTGDAYHSVRSAEVSYICIEDQLPRLVTVNGHKFVLERSLDELEKMLDPKDFYRINRQMIIRADAVRSVHKWFNNRLKLELVPPWSGDVIVSRDKAGKFREWLDN